MTTHQANVHGGQLTHDDATGPPSKGSRPTLKGTLGETINNWGEQTKLKVTQTGKTKQNESRMKHQRPDESPHRRQTRDNKHSLNK